MEAAGLLPKKRQKTTSSERQATGLKNMNFAGGQAVGEGVQRCVCIAMPLSWSPLAFGSDSPLPTPSIALDVTPYCCGGGGKLLIFQSKRFAFCQRSLDRWLIPPGIAAALVSRIPLTKKKKRNNSALILSSQPQLSKHKCTQYHLGNGIPSCLQTLKLVLVGRLEKATRDQ